MLAFQGLKIGLFIVAKGLAIGCGYIDDWDGRNRRLGAPGGGVKAGSPCSAIPGPHLGEGNVKETKF